MEFKRRQEGFESQADDGRGPFDVDYSRIVHCASFRRLQGKTQILNLGDSDFYRTRLTHSLEVSQVALGILQHIKCNFSENDAAKIYPEQSLVQTLGLSHDLGHPPFGHGGEIALNYCMRSHGGFEGNGQTLRILSRLEKFSDHSGANLTARTLLGILKYPAPYSAVYNRDIEPALLNGTCILRLLDREKSVPPKCYLDSEKSTVDWILKDFSESDRKRFSEIIERPEKHSKLKYKSFDCSIMDLADDISYGIHDLEDAIALGLIDEGAFRSDVKESECSAFLSDQKQRYQLEYDNNVYDKFVEKLFASGSIRKRQISRMVHSAISHIKIDERPFEADILKYQVALDRDWEKFLEALKECVFKRVIRSANVQHLEFKGQQMVLSVFDVLASDPESFLPEDAYKIYTECDGDIRVVCDYIAGMTDSFLLKTYDRLFSPSVGSVFDKL